MTIICENHDYFNYLKIILLISAVDNLAAYYGSLAHDIFPDVARYLVLRRLSGCPVTVTNTQEKFDE